MTSSAKHRHHQYTDDELLESTVTSDSEVPWRKIRGLNKAWMSTSVRLV